MQLNNKMVRKLIITTAALIVCGLVVGIMMLIPKQHISISTEIPRITLNVCHGNPVAICDLPNGIPTVILYFSTDCEYCESVINDMLKNRKKYDNIQLIFITQDSDDDIDCFLKFHHIDTFAHSAILIDDRLDFACKMNVSSPPTWFVYNRQGHLLRSSKGVISSAGLLKILSEQS